MDSILRGNGMKRYAKQTGRIALLMAGITAVAAIVTAFTGRVGMPRAQKTVVTTTAPLYAAACAIVGETDGVWVENLTGSMTGCLHDYQLSPSNRITLQQADLLLLNGGGAEAFLDDTLAAMPQLPTVDTSAGVDFLESTAAHGHDHADTDHDHAYNEHVWVGATRYAAQVQAVTDALCALDEANASTYAANGAAYIARVTALGERLRAAVTALPSKNCVIFHDSLAYFADELGLTVTARLHVGEESGVSPADLAAAQTAAANDRQTLVLYDSQYTARYASVDGLVAPECVLAIDTAVLGTDWLTAMEHNAILLEGLA